MLSLVFSIRSIKGETKCVKAVSALEDNSLHHIVLLQGLANHLQVSLSFDDTFAIDFQTIIFQCIISTV